jgi:protein TonB
MKNFAFLLLLLLTFLGCSRKNTLLFEIQTFGTKDTVIAVENNQQDKPLTFVEQMPSFPGGETELYQFINQNLKYPIIPEDQALATKTIVRFTITKTGEVKDVQPAMDKYKDLVLTDSVVAIIKRMPRWIPGKHKGQAVDVYYTMPLHISPARR